MTLYDEALVYKKKGEIALNRGDYENAKKYFKLALEKLKILQARSDSSLKQLWSEPIMKLEKILASISKSKPKTPTIRPKAPSLPPKQSTESAKLEEVPEDCNQDFIIPERPNLTFQDLAGLDKIKQELTENIEWPLKFPDRLKKLGVSPIKGILMFGPPGCGKTFIIKCAAGQFGITLMKADPAAILSKYYGEAEKTVKTMFRCASKLSPSIIFVDEVDKFLPSESQGTDATKRVVAQFLQEMDGVGSNTGFITVMATNEPWNINPALIRPGRVDRIIYVPPPDDLARKKLFELYLKGIDLEDNLDIDELVELTKPNDVGYYSASGIKTICDDAKRALFREWIKKGVEIPMKREFLISAIKNMPRTVTHEMIQRYTEWANKHASYTAG